MAILTCKECGGKVSDLASACPHCGAPVPTSNPIQSSNAVPSNPVSDDIYDRLPFAVKQWHISVERLQGLSGEQLDQQLKEVQKWKNHPTVVKYLQDIEERKNNLENNGISSTKSSFSESNIQNDENEYPFYKKPWFLFTLCIIIAIVLLTAIISNSNSNQEEPPIDNGLEVTPEIVESQRINDSILQANKAKDDMEYVMNISSNINLSTSDDISSFLNGISRAVDIVNAQEDPSTKKKLKKELVSFQSKMFPKARKLYTQKAKDELWRSDIDVTLSGRTINLTGGLFAANANIADTYKMLEDALWNMRFKQVNFRWYKGASEYTYYKTNAPSDEELINPR